MVMLEDGVKAFVSFKRSVLRVCNSVLASIENKFPVMGLSVDFSRGDVSFRLNGLFNSDGVLCTVQERVDQSIDMVFPLFVGFQTSPLDILIILI